MKPSFVSRFVSMCQYNIKFSMHIILFLLRVCLTLASIIWICAFFYKYKAGISQALISIDLKSISLAMVIVLLGLIPGAWTWQRLVVKTLPSVGLFRGILVYLSSGIGKYTPGGALSFVIQYRMLKPYGAKLTMLVQIFFGNAFAACLAALLLAIPASRFMIGDFVPFLWWFLCLVIFITTVLVVSCWLGFCPFVGKLLSRLGIPAPRLFFETVLLMVGAWMLTGMHLVVLSSATAVDPVFLISAYAFSAISGILFAALPGAFGIRDGALLVILLYQLPPAEAVTISLVSRALIVFGDVCGTIFSAAIIRLLGCVDVSS